MRFSGFGHCLKLFRSTEAAFFYPPAALDCTDFQDLNLWARALTALSSAPGGRSYRRADANEERSTLSVEGIALTARSSVGAGVDRAVFCARRTQLQKS